MATTPGGAAGHGEAIKRRRLALGIKNLSQFQRATGLDWETVKRVENDEASQQTVEWVLSWLERMEHAEDYSEETARTTGAPTAPITVELHGVFGISDVKLYFDGNTPAEEMTEKVRAILAGLRPTPKDVDDVVE